MADTIFTATYVQKGRKEVICPHQGVRLPFQPPTYPRTLAVVAANERDRQGKSSSTRKIRTLRSWTCLPQYLFNSQPSIQNCQSAGSAGKVKFQSLEFAVEVSGGTSSGALPGLHHHLGGGQDVARVVLQAALDAANSAARSMASAVSMRRCLWLQSFGLSQELQQSI